MIAYSKTLKLIRMGFAMTNSTTLNAIMTAETVVPQWFTQMSVLNANVMILPLQVLLKDTVLTPIKAALY